VIISFPWGINIIILHTHNNILLDIQEELWLMYLNKNFLERRLGEVVRGGHKGTNT
jgi:hypothetical protein